MFDFQYSLHDGIHTYVCSSQIVPEAIWPGLWEQTYPEEQELSPYLRFGINNGDGEPLALWRAFAWAVSEGTERYMIPSYYGDDSARAIGLDPEHVELVDWEYEVDVSDPDAEFEDADGGFVVARHVVAIRPVPTEWESSTSAKARLLPLRSLSDLNQTGRAVSEGASQITIFGLGSGDKYEPLLRSLQSPTPPILATLLDTVELLVDIAVEHDGFGRSYLSIRTKQPLEAVEELSAFFDESLNKYIQKMQMIQSFEEFGVAVEALLEPPKQ